MTELTTAATTPGVEPALVCQGNSVGVSACDLYHLDGLEKVDESRSRLVRVALDICGQVLHGWQTKLTTSRGSPRVDIALDIYGDCMAVSTSDLVDAFVA